MQKELNVALVVVASVMVVLVGFGLMAVLS